MNPIIENNSNSEGYIKATEFLNKTIGSPDAFSKKVMEFVTNNMAKNGKIKRSDYDLFCFEVVRQVLHDLTLTGLILTKCEENEDKV